MSIDLNAVYPIIDIEDAEYILGVQNGLGIRVNKPEAPEPPEPEMPEAYFVCDDVTIGSSARRLPITANYKSLASNSTNLLLSTLGGGANSHAGLCCLSYETTDSEAGTLTLMVGPVDTGGKCWIDQTATGQFDGDGRIGTELVLSGKFSDLAMPTMINTILYNHVDPVTNKREFWLPEGLTSVVQVCKWSMAHEASMARFNNIDDFSDSLVDTVRILDIPSYISNDSFNFDTIGYTDDETEEFVPYLEHIYLYVPWTEDGEDRPSYASALEAHFTDVTYEWAPTES